MSGNLVWQDTTVNGGDHITSQWNPLPTQSMGVTLSPVTILQTGATATGVGTPLPTSGFGVASIAISGTFVATITFEGQGADGSWYTINARQRGVGTISTTTTSAGLYEINCLGLSAVRANITSYTSGSVTVKGQSQALTPTSDSVQLMGSNTEGAPNTPQPTKAQLMGASDGTNIQALKVDSQGSLRTVYPDFTIPTVSVSSAATLFSQDTAGWESIAVQVISAGVSCIVMFEASNDNANWNSCTGYSVGNTGLSPPANSTPSALTFVFNCTAKYFRARVSAYGSGTVTANGYLRGCTIPIVTANQNTDSQSLSGGSSTINGLVRNAVNTTFVSGDTQFLTQTTSMQTLVKPYGLPEADWQANGINTTTTNLIAKVAGAASVRNYVTGIQYQNISATATDIQILDGASVIWRGYAPASMAIPSSIDFLTPLKGTAATALNIACGTTGSNTYINAQGYQAI